MIGERVPIRLPRYGRNFASGWKSSRAAGETLFEHLQQRRPSRFPDGQVRTLQRRIKQWRATEGPAKEVFFAQQHQRSMLCQSDFPAQQQSTNSKIVWKSNHAE
ncbi:MAG TPA: hypothetical protein VFW44_21765 [Bryobacteraceae bacterium]|nr:hypothetical protein [Bryobacteraceae bacterium]